MVNNKYWLVVNLPLWKMMEFVSWDYSSQYMEKQKMFQTTNQNNNNIYLKILLTMMNRNWVINHQQIIRIRRIMIGWIMSNPSQDIMGGFHGDWIWDTYVYYIIYIYHNNWGLFSIKHGWLGNPIDCVLNTLHHGTGGSYIPSTSRWNAGVSFQALKKGLSEKGIFITYITKQNWDWNCR